MNPEAKPRAQGHFTPAFGPYTSSMRVIAALTALLACACVESPKPEPAPGQSEQTTQSFGAPLTGKATEAALEQLLASPKAFEHRPVTVTGHVRRACSAKGCWMELSPSTKPEAAGCRVRFKDYAFFVPTDSAGARAKVEGVVQVKRVPKSRVTHLEREGAHFASKNPDGSASEVQLVATGVELTR